MIIISKFPYYHHHCTREYKVNWMAGGPAQNSQIRVEQSMIFKAVQCLFLRNLRFAFSRRSNLREINSYIDYSSLDLVREHNNSGHFTVNYYEKDSSILGHLGHVLDYSMFLILSITELYLTSRFMTELR